MKGTLVRRIVLVASGGNLRSTSWVVPRAGILRAVNFAMEFSPTLNGDFGWMYCGAVALGSAAEFQTMTPSDTTWATARAGNGLVGATGMTVGAVNAFIPCRIPLSPTATINIQAYATGTAGLVCDAVLYFDY